MDTDASGHQHNSAVIRWVEAAEAELSRSVNLPGYFPGAPRVHQSVTYTAKLWFGQRITASIGIQHMGRSSLTYAFEVYGHAHKDSNGAVAAFGTVTVANVPQSSATAQPWPAQFLAAISSLPSQQTNSAEPCPVMTASHGRLRK
ncbi:hotdog domain-containing protein [Arthrobacter sp. Rue61a]|uniref:acyl-CoA thioesterase n=1 Tax=Arthrobacter sp. Rue61a TaxID=1118963 RepID=UPI00256FDE64|nr:hotdog domain-containing protein [Arthrobacter sp. Rue61a]